MANILNVTNSPFVDAITSGFFLKREEFIDRVQDFPRFVLLERGRGEYPGDLVEKLPGQKEVHVVHEQVKA